jgi:uncharacterized protein YcbX
MTLSAISIYPVKSLKGVALPQVKVTSLGPEGDRRFMLIDEKGAFVTQRKVPKLALIGTALRDNFLILNIPDSEPLEIAIQTQGVMKDATVWRSNVLSVDQGDLAAEALSAFIGFEVRLVYMAESTLRPVDPQYAIDPSNRVSFADGFPFLIISEASLQDLNERLGQNLLMNRFRPNLVIQGVPPYAEDTWKKIRIGKILFHLVKPCSRCITTCVDQESGEKGLEPLKTLATYRKDDLGILFGQNAIHASVGILTVGDCVEIIS